MSLPLVEWGSIMLPPLWEINQGVYEKYFYKLTCVATISEISISPCLTRYYHKLVNISHTIILRSLVLPSGSGIFTLVDWTCHCQMLHLTYESQVFQTRLFVFFWYIFIHVLLSYLFKNTIVMKWWMNAEEAFCARAVCVFFNDSVPLKTLLTCRCSC